MKVVVACDSFKGSLSSLEIGNIIKKAFESTIDDCEVIVVPIADGGEGTVDALVIGTGGSYIDIEVKGPLDNNVNTRYGITGDNKTAIIEVSSASGLSLVPIDKRNPCITSTYGVGEMIIDASKRGVENIIIGLGGSSTNDGGIGMASAIGVGFYDKDNNKIKPNNKGIKDLVSIDVSIIMESMKDINFLACCDVKNPLIGKNGASYVYGKQKGADFDMIQEMDERLCKLKDIINKQLHIDVDVSGAGAAGGLGAGLLAFLDAKLVPGIDIILDSINFHNTIKDADLVITGEGQFDKQTLMNKAPMGVARVAKKYGIDVIGISAVFGDGAELVKTIGIDAIFSVVNQVGNLNEALELTEENLYIVAKNIADLIKLRG